MDKQQEVQNKTRVKFTISQDGRLEFDSTGDSYELTDALNQAQKIAEGTRVARQKIEQIKSSSELASHIVFFCFLTTIVFVTAFAVSRVVSTQFQPQLIHQGSSYK